MRQTTKPDRAFENAHSGQVAIDNTNVLCIIIRMQKGLVIIPTYNESANIEKIINVILAVSPQLEILVIDDNSPDNTPTVANTIAVGSVIAAVIASSIQILNCLNGFG